MIQSYLLIHLLYYLIVVQATYSKVGCFKESSVLSLLSYNDEYQYQSSLHCEQTCDTGVIGLMDGKYCYCGNTVPTASEEVDESNCDTICQGYGLENCGGNGYFLIYADSSASTQASSSSATSTSTSSSSSASSSSSSSFSSTTTQSSSSSSSSLSSAFGSSSSISIKSSSASSSTTSTTTSSSSTAPSNSTSVVIATRSNSVVTETIYFTHSPSVTSSSASVTSSSPSALTSGSSKDTGSGKSSKSHRLSAGGIAGAVVGSVVGVALIAGVILFLCYKRRRDSEDRDDEFTLSGPANEKLDVFTGPYYGEPVVRGHQREPSKGDHTESYSNTTEDAFYFEMDEHNLGSEQGRRRLSNGSLPDMMTRNPGSLKVVN